MAQGIRLGNIQCKMLSLCHGCFSQDWQCARPAVHVERVGRLSGSVSRVGSLGHQPIHRSISCQALYRSLAREPRPPAEHLVAWDIAWPGIAGCLSSLAHHLGLYPGHRTPDRCPAADPGLPAPGTSCLPDGSYWGRTWGGAPPGDVSDVGDGAARPRPVYLSIQAKCTRPKQCFYNLERCAGARTPSEHSHV